MQNDDGEIQEVSGDDPPEGATGGAASPGGATSGREMTGSRRKSKTHMQEGEPPAPPLPPDGGWGWVVVFASLVCNIIVDGICFSFGMFFIELVEYFGESKGKTAFVGSLIPGMYLGMGPVASALANKYSIRSVVIAGTLISSAAIFLSPFAPNLDVLILTYGILGGIGFGLMYLPAIVIVNFYFVRKRALATGIAVCGSGVGTFIFTSFAPYLIRNYGWRGSYWILSGIVLHGIICALVFRPLEAEKPKPPRPAISTDNIPINRGIIMEKIIEEKKRQRTISEHTLDGAIITKNNEIIKDQNLLKKVLLKPLAEENPNNTQSDDDDNSIQTNGKDRLIPNGSPNGRVSPGGEPTGNHLEVPGGSPRHIPLRKISAPASPHNMTPRNKHLDRVKGNMGSGPNLFSSSTSLGKRKRTTSNASELWRRGDFGSKSNLEQREFKREIARPLYRQDIFYTGSVTSLATYQSNRSLKSYIDSNTSIPEPEPEEIGTCEERCLPFIHILTEMVNFSLLKSPTFIPLCLTSVLAMLGFFTPFVYLVDYSVDMGVDKSKAAMLLQLLGISNTAGRIISGWISDRPWADCLLIHNLALVLAGLTTCLVPFIASWELLMVYAVVFGGCIAAFIALRTIVLTDLLGIEKLSSSFGILLLFQGVASLCGTPLAGAIYDATGGYVYSFVISGLVIFLAGAISLPVRRIKAWEDRKLYQLEEDPEGFPGLPLPNGDVITDVSTNDVIGSQESKGSKKGGKAGGGVKFGGNSYSKLATEADDDADDDDPDDRDDRNDDPDDNEAVADVEVNVEEAPKGDDEDKPTTEI